MKQRKYAYSIPEMTRRLLGKAEPIRGYLVVSTLASVIGNISRMTMMAFGALWILSETGNAEGSSLLWLVLTCLSGALIAVCRYLEGVYSHKGAYGILASMRVDLFAKIDRLAPAYLVEHDTGSLLNAAVSDIEQLEFFFAHMIGPLFTVILLPLITILLAFRYSAVFGCILIPVFLLVSVIIPLIALKAGRGAGVRFRTSMADLKSTVLESVYGIRDLQIFHGTEKAEETMLERNRALNRSAHAIRLNRAVMSSVPDFFVYLARIFLVAAGGWLATQGMGQPVGTIVVSFASTAAFSSTFSLTAVVSNLLQTYGAAERIFLIEDARPSVQEDAHPHPLEPINTVEFEDVSFTYPHTGVQVLDHVSFTIHEGERVGLIGESGTGKSTILRLLLRYYDPDEGRILINGIDLRKYRISDLRQKLGLLEQDTYLFDDTIAANIAIGKKQAEEKEIRNSAKKAGIAAFIDTLPDGYETRMGSMNSRLSGGERQRIGIARILLKDPEFLILDEPTSALDVLHEKELLDTLRKEYKGRTVLMISHRMSSLADCTRILKLEDRKIKETA
jgi:ATP-binding cassette subfamily C protein